MSARQAPPICFVITDKPAHNDARAYILLGDPLVRPDPAWLAEAGLD